MSTNEDTLPRVTVQEWNNVVSLEADSHQIEDVMGVFVSGLRAIGFADDTIRQGLEAALEDL